MIPPEHIATMREALQTWSEMLERRANTVERHGVAGTTYRKHIAEIDAALAYLDTLPTALDAANQRVQELESRSAHLEELLEGQEMARQSLEAKIKYLNTELQAYTNAYHRTLPPGSTRTRRKRGSHE